MRLERTNWFMRGSRLGMDDVSHATAGSCWTVGASETEARHLREHLSHYTNDCQLTHAFLLQKYHMKTLDI